MGSPYPVGCRETRTCAPMSRTQTFTSVLGAVGGDQLVDLINRLPEDVTPFGADLFPSDVTWAKQPVADLFPTALDLDNLDKSQVKQLRTWFVVSGSWLNNQRRQHFAKKQNFVVLTHLNCLHYHY